MCRWHAPRSSAPRSSATRSIGSCCRPELEEEELALVNAVFSLSKSLSACLLVRAAVRRSAESAAATSL